MLNIFRAIILSLSFAAAVIVAPILTPNAAAQTAAPAAKPTKPPRPSQVALRDRQKKCGAEWKAAKSAGSIEKNIKWPQYWSACNKRLKGGG
jgi:hypothetical protein